MSRHDDPHPRRHLIGSWLDWIDSAAGQVPVHRMERAKLLPAVLSLRAVAADWGPDSPVTHRAQAAFLAAVRPDDLFELLLIMAYEGMAASDEEEQG